MVGLFFDTLNRALETRIEKIIKKAIIWKFSQQLFTLPGPLLKVHRNWKTVNT